MQLASAIRSQFSRKIDIIDVKEAKMVGTFDVFYGDDLVFSKQIAGRLPRSGEVEQILEKRIE